MPGTEPAGRLYACGRLCRGKRCRHHRGALRSGCRRKPSAGMSPKDGTEHGLSLLVTRLKTKGRGFAYETQDPLASGIVSRQNGNCPASAFPWEKLLLRKAVSVSIQQVMVLHRQANAPHGMRETRC